MQFHTIISAIGTRQFDDALFSLLRLELGAEEIVVHRYRPRRPVEVLASRAAGGAKALESAVRLYVGSYHRRDPLLARLTSLPSVTPLVGTIHADEITDADYRRRLFVNRGIQSKATMLMREGELVTTLSAYGRQPGGQDRSVALLTEWSLMLGAAIQKHATLVAPSRFDTLEAMISALHNACAGKLSAREAAVCSRILCGYSTEGTGLDLALSNNSVATYRRRAYCKLGISSQSELFRLLLRSGSTGEG